MFVGNIGWIDDPDNWSHGVPERDMFRTVEKGPRCASIRYAILPVRNLPHRCAPHVVMARPSKSVAVGCIVTTHVRPILASRLSIAKCPVRTRCHTNFHSLQRLERDDSRLSPYVERQKPL